MKALRTTLRRVSQVSGVTLEDLARNKRLDFLVTSDFHRVDLAFVIRRKPVYLPMEDLDFENVELEHKMRWKYDLYPLVNKEMLDVGLVDQAQTPARSEITPLYKRMPDGSKYYYNAESKSFNEISPHVRSLTSIQRQPSHSVYFLCRCEGRWVFPSHAASVEESLSLGKERLMRELGAGIWGANFVNRYPLSVRREGFLERDRENPYWMKCVGRKVFYFEALHDWGVGGVVPQFGTEYVWAAKHELNRFLSREDFDFFKRHLEEAD